MPRPGRWTYGTTPAPAMEMPEMTWPEGLPGRLPPGTATKAPVHDGSSAHHNAARKRGMDRIEKPGLDG